MVSPYNQPIPLANPKPAERLFKRGARALFTLVRSTVGGQSQRVPGTPSQAGADVREASWVFRPIVTADSGPS